MDFFINGHSYRTNRLSVVDAYHVARRYAFVLFSIGDVLTPQKTPADYAKAILVASQQIAQADADYVIERCLGVVQRQQPGGAWAPLWVANAGIMFQDMDLTEMLQVVFHVLEDNKLFSFFAASDSTSSPQAAA